ncbi:MAG: protein kinase [Myxococcota bacterium]
MTTRPSTQPAVSDATHPSASTLGRAPTRVAPGAVPPANLTTQPGNERGPGVTPHSPTERIQRDHRVGTHLQGAEGLNTPGAEAPKLRLTQGKVIPGTRYKIIRWLGEGGMGVVYEAEHVDIERRVALKILRFDLSQQPHMVKVFKDEAKAAGRLGSQYLVDLYDFGELPDGRLFFAMELLDGADLVPPDAEYSMDPGTLIGILRQTCKGLGVAHKAGVVHRDIKPENILTTSAPDGREQVKIVDFGISSMLAAGQQSGGGLAGTPHYMAPELILSQPYDGRLDIYALGCMAYELLTGEPPFDAKTVEVLLEKQVNEIPLNPSDRRPDKRIPAELQQVVMRCLAKDPAGRYRDTADLEAALCEAQIAGGLTTEWDDLPLPELPAEPERIAAIAARMPSPLANGGQKKRAWLWPVVAGVSTLLAAGLGAFLILGGGPTEEEVNEVDELTTLARGAASRANWVVPPADDPDGDTAYLKVLALEELEGTAEDLGDERGEELRAEFSGTLVKQADELYEHGATDLATHYYFYALVFDDTNTYAFERSQTTPGMLANYLAAAKRGEFSDLDRMLSNTAAAELESDPEKKEERLAAAAAAMDEGEGVALAAQGKSTAKLLNRKSKKGAAEEVDPLVAQVTRDNALPPSDPVAVEDEPEPEPELDETAANKKKSRRPRRKTSDPTVLLGQAERDPEKASTLADQGMAALRAGRRSEASSLFNQAISHDRKNGKALMGLSDVYFDTGKNQKAVEYAEKAVRASPANRSYRLKLGDAYFKVLRYRDALEQYEQAKKRGSTKADARIAKVKPKLGG